MHKKILAVSPVSKDSNCFWRAMGPMSYLTKNSNGTIDIDLYDMERETKGIMWSDLSKYDILFLHRPCTEDHLSLMKIAFNLNIPVWIDYDDWLYGLPSWNPNAEFYYKTPVQMAMSQCLACADVVTVSTVELYNELVKINPNTVIVPNSYRSDIFYYRKSEVPTRENVIFWRGSNTHEGDLLSVKDGMAGLKFPVKFMGGVNWMTLAGMPAAGRQVLGGYDPIVYWRVIHDDIKPKVLIMPLVDCFFNRCKSNIAYIEALHMGAICVAPNMPEWNRAGVVTYEAHNAESFQATVNSVCDLDPEQHAEIVSMGFHEMKNQYDITVTNKIRQQIVEHLTGPEPYRNGKNPYDQTLGSQVLTQMQKIQNGHTHSIKLETRT